MNIKILIIAFFTLLTTTTFAADLCYVRSTASEIEVTCTESQDSSHLSFNGNYKIHELKAIKRLVENGYEIKVEYDDKILLQKQ